MSGTPLHVFCSSSPLYFEGEENTDANLFYDEANKHIFIVKREMEVKVVSLDGSPTQIYRF